MPNYHPIFVHFPIALLSMGVVFDAAGALIKSDSLRHAGWWCLVSGIAFLAATVGTGLWAQSTVPHSNSVHSIMENHKTLGFAASGIFAMLFLWRAINRARHPKRPLLLVPYFIFAISGVSVMFYGAHLGGIMVYEHGVGVTAVGFREEGGHKHDHGEGHTYNGGIFPPGDSSRGGKVEKGGKVHMHRDGSFHEH